MGKVIKRDYTSNKSFEVQESCCIGESVLEYDEKNRLIKSLPYTINYVDCNGEMSSSPETAYCTVYLDEYGNCIREVNNMYPEIPDKNFDISYDGDGKMRSWAEHIPNKSLLPLKECQIADDDSSNYDHEIEYFYNIDGQVSLERETIIGKVVKDGFPRNNKVLLFNEIHREYRKDDPSKLDTVLIVDLLRGKEILAYDCQYDEKGRQIRRNLIVANYDKMLAQPNDEDAYLEFQVETKEYLD